MSRSRRFFEPNDDQSHRGPSDEMLAVDAASEMRSMTLLYERWADRLYRYFLLCTADPDVADRMLRDLLARLPEDLQRFGGQDRSFGGWLFSQASSVFWQEYSVPSRVYRRVSRYLPSRLTGESAGDSGTSQQLPVLSGFEEVADALKAIPPDRREVLGIHIGAQLRTAAAAEALRLPASLISSHVQWSLEALGEQLESSNTRRLSEDLSELINRQALSNQQRQRHFSLIHGVFLGEVEIESEDAQRAPVFEIGALIGVVVVGLIAIWIWGLVTEGDTREHEVASSPPAETAADSDPTPTPTIEPEPTPEPTPEPELTPVGPLAEDTGPMTCMAAEGKAQFDRFVSHFNEGDFESLAAMIPDEDYENPQNESAPENGSSEGWNFVHDGTSVEGRQALLQFLEDRYERGERWDVLEAYPAEHYRNWQGAAPLEMYQDWKRENPELSMIIVAGLDWSADDDPTEVAQGRVVIDCDAGLVIRWDIESYANQNPPPVGLDEYLQVMEPLQPGESRFIWARVYTDSRPDGGLLSSWDLEWLSEVKEDGTEAERIEISTLDGYPQVVFVRNNDRWSIDQRGWMIYGGDENPPLSDEIALPMPWLRELPEVLAEHEQEISANTTISLSDDFAFTASGGVERVLDIDVREGNLLSVTARERTPNGERVRPRIELLGANRDDGFPPEQFEVGGEPDFPQLITDEPRYRVPAGEHEQLEFISLTPEETQTYETYRISWDGLALDLRVAPSRGGLDETSVTTPLDDSWTTVVDEYRWGRFVWAHRHFAGYPTDAIWDDGRYLFALAVDRQANPPEYGWDLEELIELINALSADLELVEPSGFAPDTGTDSGHSRGNIYLASDRTR